MRLDADTAYALADLLLLQARLFSPPATARESRFADGELTGLVRRCGDAAPEAHAQRIAAAIDALATGDIGELEIEFSRLFAGDIACPINEAGYIRRDKGAILGDIQGFYRAFGIAVILDSEERGDHLICELEFLGLLLVMYGNARRNGADEHAETSREAARAFAADHLGEWVGSFCERLAFVTECEAYAAATDSLRSTWSLIVEAFELPEVDTVAAPVETAVDEQSGWSCGGAPKNVLQQGGAKA